MKTLLNGVKTLLTVATLVSLYSCQKEESQVKPQATTEEVQMSVQEAYELANAAEPSNAANRPLIQKSETRTYDFEAAFTDGSAKQPIAGVLEIKLSATLSPSGVPPTSRSFRGTLTLPNSTVIKASGSVGSATLGKDAVRVFFFLPDGQVILGTGTASSTGQLTGTFQLLENVFPSGKVLGTGRWVAKPKSKPTRDGKTIVEIAAGDPRFTTLVSALKQTGGLVEVLNGPGPYTVFAPTNDAFAALSSLPAGDPLRQVLLYHLVSGKFTAASLANNPLLMTFQGNNIRVSISKEGEVILNDRIKVIQADIEANNGIIHVINAVLIPPADTKK